MEQISVLTAVAITTYPQYMLYFNYVDVFHLHCLIFDQSQTVNSAKTGLGIGVLELKSIVIAVLYPGFDGFYFQFVYLVQQLHLM